MGEGKPDGDERPKGDHCAAHFPEIPLAQMRHQQVEGEGDANHQISDGLRQLVSPTDEYS